MDGRSLDVQTIVQSSTTVWATCSLTSHQTMNNASGPLTESVYWWEGLSCVTTQCGHLVKLSEKLTSTWGGGQRVDVVKSLVIVDADQYTQKSTMQDNRNRILLFIQTSGSFVTPNLSSFISGFFCVPTFV